jgi:protein-tyrosine-phosphatase
MKILFVCKYNRFRSRIAEAYFNKINKNKKIKTDSAGLIQGSYPLDKEEVEVAKEFKIKLKGKPKALSYRLLKENDVYIVVADNVPISIFETKRYKKRIIRWKIKDVRKAECKESIRKVIKQIITKVDKLNEVLK